MNRSHSVLLIGGGRMGRAILEAAQEAGDVAVSGVVTRGPARTSLPGEPPRFTDLAEALAAAPRGVVLDFAAADGTAERVTRVSESEHSLVLGTTGGGPEVESAVAAAAARIAVVVAPNTSPGLALLRRALAAAVPPSGLGWDPGILERHHRGKRDAPSGTARVLREDLEIAFPSPVPVVSLRQGGVVGEHVVHLSGEDEELVLIHRAFSRRVFARGALLAARYAAGARPGRYGMEDVLAGS